ncbi:DUF4127 family protein [Pediococcus siamensis]|uniref:DUF4127 family protein n=1 Tax=Pediococcus siamensis TaxID=381829 RepID=UPI0039A1C0A3
MKKKILYIPLDERPCNYDYPLRLFENHKSIKVTYPPKKLLSHKKKAANVEDLRNFILENIQGVDILIYSSEMLVYGGLLPSRIYSVSKQKPNIIEYINFIKSLKKQCPKLLIYVSNLIMRTPKYNSDDEEPEYYANYGSKIFKYGWLLDKEKRADLSVEEQNEKNDIASDIPREIRMDYEKRRKINLKVNLVNINLVKEGRISYLAIPQDDSATFGYTAMDQAKVYSEIKCERLQDKVSVYPGADESGYTLLSRAIQTIEGYSLKIFPIFSSDIGKLQIPLYEDRPLCESLKSHVLAAGANLVYSPEEADIILAVNTPGEKMIEANLQQVSPDLTYDTFRNLRSFVATINYYIELGKSVVLADCAFANGADLELISMLDEKKIVKNLIAYRAWNTTCNTLGSSISAAVILYSEPRPKKNEELVKTLLDDGLYQAVVRSEITQELDSTDADYFNLGNQTQKVIYKTESSIKDNAKKYLRNSLTIKDLERLKIEFPWNRMFEINCILKNRGVNNGK